MKENYGTLSETINGLKKEGYDFDFNIQEDCVVCHGANMRLSPEEFEIDKVFRFEGESDPADEAILYAISSSKHDVKGVLVNGYNISAEPASSSLISKLSTHPDL